MKNFGGLTAISCAALFAQSTPPPAFEIADVHASARSGKTSHSSTAAAAICTASGPAFSAIAPGTTSSLANSSFLPFKGKSETSPGSATVVFEQAAKSVATLNRVALRVSFFAYIPDA